ncbi:S8 family serine peptidase [Vibrio salinus]|uniref:S8 family serine peptidase n=1 Tax=Vibrio salinus TaxID=2899784 RepID=UPI001E2C08D7|nr:S8 family serine peptidase [Vibrio salinus]MCE0494868.1 S8 family serine peptidase [Vibrio salinus]
MLTALRINTLRTLIFPFLFLFFIGLTTSIANAATPQARAALENNPGLAYSTNSVLIRFTSNALPNQKQQARQLVNGTLIRGYGIVNALEHLQLGPGRNVDKAIETLQQLPFVSYAEPDYVIRPDTNDQYYGLLWGLENTGQDIRGVTGVYDSDIDADLAWSTTTGNPDLIVAVIDTGVDYNHNDLNENVWINPGEIAGNGIDDDGNGYIDDIYGYDFFSNDSNPIDEEGHGTHVAGTICAESNNNIGISGVAWQCKIMALRFLGPNGGYTSDAITALDYAVAKGVKISNNSWGGGGYSQGLYDAISNAAANGHVFVAAAGNGGADSIGDDTDILPHYPSSYNLENIISVAATNNRDQLAGFSNYGLNSVDVGAPGVNIVSTMLGSYYWSSGTSMAAPHVAGVAALILSLHPDWGYTEIKDRLLSTIRPVAVLSGKTVTGGVIDAQAATTDATSVPNAPDNLTTTVVSHDQIALSWRDNADNELGFVIERSQDSGQNWSELVNLAANTENYNDSELDAETTYTYRVYAYNSVGNSSNSYLSSATTDPAPDGQEILTNSELFSAGSVEGTYVDTWNADGVYQTLTERRSGGKPSNRYSLLQHTWVFNVPAGSSTLYLNAWSDISTDGDIFEFSYSLDGNTFTDLLTVSGGSNADWHSVSFPPGTSGTVYIQVNDSNHTAGNLELNTIFVDKMYILSESNTGTIPAAPSGLAGTATVEGQIDLTWTDNASDESGFEIERSLTGTGNWSLIKSVTTDVQAYSDESVASETTYDYRVRAFNGAGYSSYSNLISVTSLATTMADLELTGNSYISGWQYVDLQWNNPEMVVDIYRDGNTIATLAGGTYTDAKIARGTGVQYTYQVCETETDNCSNVFVASF